MKDKFSDEDKQSYIDYRIEQARQALTECDDNIRNEHYNVAVNRLYYGAFYAAQALFMHNNIEASTHKGVKSQLFLHFVKSGKLAPRYNQIFTRLLDRRSESDYDAFVYYSADIVAGLRSEAEDFIETIIALITP